MGVHLRSRFYDVEGWLKSHSGPPRRESAALGDLNGKTLVHLQCHFGMDTLSWARVGALVTGVDFSPNAIEEATALAVRAELSERATFVRSSVDDAPQVLAGKRFDVVYVSLGSLCWLPDVANWAAVVAELLVPGGRLYLHDVHPFSSCFDENGERVIYGYFEEGDRPFVDDYAYTYTDGAAISATRTYEWNHSLGEIVGALQQRGVVLDALDEHDWTVFQQFPWLDQSDDGRFVTPEGRHRIPLTFTILAHVPE